MTLRGGGAEAIQMPPIMYGTAWKKERTEELVTQAVTLGFRGIDTACQPKHYYEPGVGAALAKLEQAGISRSSLFIQTKYTPIRGQDPNNVPYDTAATIPQQVQQSVAVSLKNLNTSYIDSLVLHSPLPTHEENMAAWRVLETFVQQGVIGQLGISNCYDLSVLQAIAKEALVQPSVVQNRFYKDSNYDKDLRAWCKERGIKYQSFWTLTGNPHLLSSPPLRAAAKRLSKTPEQVLFAFVAHLGVTPLSGTTSVEHMKEDLQVFQGGLGAPLDLTADEITAISRLL
eukprot:CAMPEP_0179433654 /NCGR_PEP_ID=MMETSP0799-20121207/18028_1 /TAXON_ID=46947 /ORGANISM="Geminigera cryophila, Strain CCMP2564" /LENGTH=285 /DNA_ID=CAMNT_0021211769 /DNA_START=146 /DNA_END=1003 /DNA_ORIENTATION=-